MSSEKYDFKTGDYVMMDGNPEKRGTVGFILNDDECSVRWVFHDKYSPHNQLHTCVNMKRLAKLPFPGQKKRGRPKKNA